MSLMGPALSYPLMPLADQHLCAQLKLLIGHWYFCTYFNVLHISTNNQTVINKKEAYTSPNNSTKITNNKITSLTKK
jgi:hypothetical protein